MQADGSPARAVVKVGEMLPSKDRTTEKFGTGKCGGDWDLFVPNISVESSVGSDHGCHGFSRMNWIRIRAVRGWGLRSRTAPEWCRAGARRRAAVASRSGRAQIGVCDTSPRIHNWITTWICLNRKERKERRVKGQWDQCTPCFLSLRPLRSLRLNNAG